MGVVVGWMVVRWVGGVLVRVGWVMVCWMGDGVLSGW